MCGDLWDEGMQPCRRKNLRFTKKILNPKTCFFNSLSFIVE